MLLQADCAGGVWARDGGGGIRRPAGLPDEHPVPGALGAGAFGENGRRDDSAGEGLPGGGLSGVQGGDERLPGLWRKRLQRADILATAAASSVCWLRSGDAHKVRGGMKYGRPRPMHFLFQLKLSRGHTAQGWPLGSEQLVAAAVELRQQLAHHTLHPANHHHPSTGQSGKPWRNSASDFRAQMWCLDEQKTGLRTRAACPWSTRWRGTPARGRRAAAAAPAAPTPQPTTLRRPPPPPLSAASAQARHPTIRRAKGHHAQMFSVCLGRGRERRGCVPAP